VAGILPANASFSAWIGSRSGGSCCKRRGLRHFGSRAMWDRS
jgi:hypothetical protein